MILFHLVNTVKRLAWLEVELQRTEKDVYIFMHHPPFDIGLPYMDRIKLDEAVTFGKLIANYKNIRHIFLDMCTERYF